MYLFFPWFVLERKPWSLGKFPKWLQLEDQVQKEPEQPLKKLSVLFLLPHLPAASLPPVTFFTVIYTTELQAFIKIFSARNQVSPGAPVNLLLILLLHYFVSNRTEGRIVRGLLCILPDLCFHGRWDRICCEDFFSYKRSPGKAIGSDRGKWCLHHCV